MCITIILVHQDIGIGADTLLVLNCLSASFTIFWKPSLAVIVKQAVDKWEEISFNLDFSLSVKLKK